MEPTYDIRRILDFLPHRYPFILIDRVVEIIPGKRIIGLKNVSINEPFFQGHFPARPIMPGVLIVEALGQAGGVLHLSSMGPDRKGKLLYFMGFDKVRFRKPVVPGDQLMLVVEILKQRAKAIRMTGQAKVNDKLVAEAEFLATIGDAL
jgi:3-hydroxyacyl-[acyl-carrier-protein] dehydratase